MKYNSIMGNLKAQFIPAYQWMHGGSKRKAEQVYNRAMEIADYDFIREVITCYKCNSKLAFYMD